MRSFIAIVGRPNVGKSTLFNRLTGYDKAIVDDLPGVTRDRLYAEARLDRRTVTLIDTGGFEPEQGQGLQAQIRAQMILALEEADLTVLLLDGKNGLNPHDRDLVDLLRRSDTRFLVAVNKIDGPEMENLALEFHSLGVDSILSLSAAHGYGLRDFKKALLDLLPPEEDTVEREEVIRVAVIGRPNVGKSSLLNSLIGQERSLVSDRPGTTRDTVDAEIIRQGRTYLFVDTAGIRRKGRTGYRIEKFAVIRALRAMEGCDVALLLIDSLEGITDQDAHVAGYAVKRGRGLILVFNKWDLVEDKKTRLKQIKGQIELKLRFLTYIPHVTVSAKTGLRVRKIFDMINLVFSQYSSRVSTSQVNQVLERAVEAHVPPYIGQNRLKFFYATQSETRPPGFTIFTNRPDKVHFSYERYLTNVFREAFGLDSIPIKLNFRARRGKKENLP